jgi:hypothetical protein
MNGLRVQLFAHCAFSGDGSGDWRETHYLGDSPSSGALRCYLGSEHPDPRASTTPSLLSPLIVGVYSVARPSWLTPGAGHYGTSPRGRQISAALLPLLNAVVRNRRSS